MTERQVIYFCPIWRTEKYSQRWQLSETEKFTLRETRYYIWTPLIPGCMLGFSGSGQCLIPSHPHSEQQGMTWGSLNTEAPHLFVPCPEMVQGHRTLQQLRRLSTSTDTQQEAAGGRPWTRGSNFCFRWARKGSSTFFPLASPLAWTWPIPEHPWATATDLKGPHSTRMTAPRALFLSVLTQQITKAGIEQEGGTLLKEYAHQTFLQTSL